MPNGSVQPAGPPLTSDPPHQGRLDSWKEIAGYLGRDVRTVRRWEKEQRLPVHRHHHQKAASIYAYKSELDAWWKHGQANLGGNENDGARAATLPWPNSSSGKLPASAADRRAPHRWWIVGAFAALLLAGGGTYLAGHRRSVPPPSRAVVLAVLPFEDMDPNPQDYLVDGLTEEMIARLTRISPPSLRVIARTSAMQYRHTTKSARQIGQELGADYILENSLRHEGGRFRIITQLVRAADQTHLWAENYDREGRELLTLEREVTTDIAEQISRQLLPSADVRPPPSGGRAIDPEAYNSYLQGRYYLNQRTRESLRKSIEAFDLALTKDPAFAAAYAGLADADNLSAFYGLDPKLDIVARAKVAADKAVQLDDSLAAGHAALAYTEFMWREDWHAAEREFRRALELDDNYVPAHQWYALFLAASDRTDEALHHMEFAKRIDPLSPAVHAGLAYVLYLARHYDQAIQEARTALELNPNSMAAHATLGWAFTEQKNYAAAMEELQTASKLSGGVPVYQCSMARVYALQGDTRQARKIVAAVESISAQPLGSGSAIASAYLALGDSQRALTWLDESAPGDIQINWLRVDPAFDSLRSDSRFAAVVSRIGVKKE